MIVQFFLIYNHFSHLLNAIIVFRILILLVFLWLICTVVGGGLREVALVVCGVGCLTQCLWLVVLGGGSELSFFYALRGGRGGVLGNVLSSLESGK